jgi:NAD(P)-dependent dehydrogenase (short-subunit alcohol dehydrogenase family)
MLAVTGYNSRIVQELLPLLPEGEEVIRIDEHVASETADRFVLCAGLLYPKTLEEQSNTEIHDILRVNLIDPMQICDLVLQANSKARICIVGSESGFTWSHNGAYAAAKAAIHRYVETKKLGSDQQLVCVAPSIIGDCSMTTSRADTENLERRRQEHPKQRFLRAAEVARLVHYCLYVDEGYLSGTVIRLNGGPA